MELSECRVRRRELQKREEKRLGHGSLNAIWS